MIHLQVPWAAVAEGAEIVGPDGKLWTVVRRSEVAAQLKCCHGELVDIYVGTLAVPATVAIRSLDDAISLITFAFPAAQVIGQTNIRNEWTAPLELDPDGLAAHLHAFHYDHIPAARGGPKLTAAAYLHHATLHRTEGVSIPHAHV